MSISQRLTAPRYLYHRLSHHNRQCIPHVPPHDPVAPYRLVALQPQQRQGYALSLTKTRRPCCPLLPRRRSPSQRRTSKRGQCQSSISSSDCSRRVPTAKRIGTKHTFLSVHGAQYCYCLHRWSKISKAMGGRRTPRQVASRVQKYFEKLKLFGVTVT
jgi:hypothetical protein